MSLYTAKGLLKLAEIVQNARFARDMRQKEFAAACGLSTATICRLESGDCIKTPTDETLEKVALFIGLTREELKAIAEEREYGNGHEDGINAFATLELLSNIKQMNESQLNLLFSEIVKHPALSKTSLTRYVRLILDRIDVLV